MDLTRRAFLRGAAAAAGCLAAGVPTAASETVNDVQSRLNATRVARVLRPRTEEELASIVRRAACAGRSIAVSGARHAMGGQQFLRREWLLDMRGLDRVRALDLERGIAEVEAGIQWPAFLSRLAERQTGAADRWTIVQKQTGTDTLTLGGAIAANAHGRVLTTGPISAQVESLRVLGPDGRIRTASREENADLFRLVVGGYGLFGPIVSVRLRLRKRTLLERKVALVESEGLAAAFADRIRGGAEYGDWQYATDLESGACLREGILSTYAPAPSGSRETPEAERAGFSSEDWSSLYVLAHTDRKNAFATYARDYAATSGQVYGSDDQQRALYDPHYHRAVDRATRPRIAGTEVLTEIDVPLPRLGRFLAAAREAVRQERMDLIYGVVRLIARDEDSFLPWARGRFACVIFNLHTPHDRAGLAAATRHFRRLIDIGLAHGGTFYLTYHRWATAEQTEAAYPEIRDFLEEKRARDPRTRFSSDWHRHLSDLFS